MHSLASASRRPNESKTIATKPPMAARHVDDLLID
jgi:hypothetical protein